MLKSSKHHPAFKEASVVSKPALRGTRLQVGAQLIHAVQRVKEELSYGVDLHQSQVVQLQNE